MNPAKCTYPLGDALRFKEIFPTYAVKVNFLLGEIFFGNLNIDISLVKTDITLKVTSI